MNRRGALALLLALAAALALRLPRLGERPLHNDEGVNAAKLAVLADTGRFAYDPDEFHGPALYYASLPLARSGLIGKSTEWSDAALRLTPVAFGTGLILLLLLLRDALDNAAMIWAAIFTAVSPAMVFYSRYFIHEMLLVFFTLLTIAAGWRYWRSREAAWAGLAGAGLGLMHATKETFVLAVVAMGLALVLTVWWNTWRARRSALTGTVSKPPRSLRALFRGQKRAHLLLGCVIAMAVSVMLFSSFFTNAAGLIDSVRAYLPWLRRAGGQSPHLHPWYFYFERLLWTHPGKGLPWSEGVIALLALTGVWAGFSSRRTIVGHASFVRFLAIYSFSLAALYSMIPYKTPWCLLGFWSGMILLAGVGAAALLRIFQRRVARSVCLTLLLAGVAQLAWQSWRAGVTQASDRDNPYTYAQSGPELRPLVDRVRALALAHRDKGRMPVQIISPESYWPLPWSLRNLQRTGWYDSLPAEPLAPVVIVSANLRARLDEKTNKPWIMTGLYEIRPGVFYELYVEPELWTRFVPTLPRDPD